MKQILIRPLVTEKITKQQEKLGQYGFIVDTSANKIEIKEAVEKMFSVSVQGVSTMIMPKKSKQRFTKTSILTGSKPKYKKAIVTLAKGESIDFFAI